MWFCFHSSCKAKGNITKEISMAEIKKSLSGIDDSNTKEKEKQFIVPKSFTSIFSADRCMDYVKKNNCINAYNKGLADIRYDVRQHRAVFLIKEKEKVKGAVGRGLNSQVYPKWFMYGNKTHPFICGANDVGVLVEDCASACAVSHLYSGIALMGTSLPDSYIPVLKEKFKKIIVALDRDATTKAFDISNQLRYYMDSEVKILEDDLKYYDEQQIEKLLK